MPRQTRYKGTLAKPIDFAGRPPDDEEGRISVEEFEAQETERRIRLLYEHYNVRYGASEDLLYLLAFEHVPGFEFRYASETAKGGRKKLWTEERLISLAQDVDYVREHAKLAHRKTISGACKYLVQSVDFPQWSAPREGQARWAENLADRYSEGKALLKFYNINTARSSPKVSG